MARTRTAGPGAALRRASNPGTAALLAVAGGVAQAKRDNVQPDFRVDDGTQRIEHPGGYGHTGFALSKMSN